MSTGLLNSSWDASDTRFLCGLIGFLTLGPALIAGKVVLHNQYGLPDELLESCYMPQTSVTIGAVVNDFANCKAKVSRFVPNLNLAQEDQELQLVANQLVPDAQLDRSTKQAIETIFSDARIAIDEQADAQNPPMVSVAEDLFVILFLVWLMPVMFLLWAMFDLSGSRDFD